MDFTNETPFPSTFLTGSTGEQEIVAIAATKVTCVLENGELVGITGDEAWPVFEKPFSFQGVTIGAETDFRKRGVDLLVFGSARALRGEPVTWTRVVVECGEVRHETVVFGDRTWVGTGAGFMASDPAPFTEMPLTNDRALGGEARLDATTVVPHPLNPEGRGYVLLEEDVEGTSLPNLEHPDRLIGSWMDQPPPRCFFKPEGMVMPEGAGERPPEETAIAIAEAGFNQTVAGLVAPDEGALGDTLRLSGLSEDGDIVFPMPPTSGPVAHIRVGDRRSRFAARLSTLVALPAEKVLVATYLAVFRYLVFPEELRSTVLKWPDALASRPGPTPEPA